MTETVPARPFDDMEVPAWLRSQPDGRVTASAAELGRRWGWNRMRAGRRLRAWQEAGHVRRNAEEIMVITSVTPTVTEAVRVTVMPAATVARRSMTPVKLGAFIVALALACVSAAFSIDGLTAIFAGAFWPVITMGAALEAGKGQTVADLDRRIAQIDAAVEESTRLGRPVGAMTIADRKRRDRADIVAARQREAQALAGLQIEKAKIDAQRRRAEADVGPVRYLAELIDTPATDLERPVRLLTLALVAVLDPLAVALLLTAGTHTRRVGSR
jgi:hypothetical protein